MQKSFMWRDSIYARKFNHGYLTATFKPKKFNHRHLTRTNIRSKVQSFRKKSYRFIGLLIYDIIGQRQQTRVFLSKQNLKILSLKH